ncbi:MAG: flagellar biosynthesis protein FlhA [Candidatus Competibacteraceae bacterium]|nr:flagellar biosynthesis protein FlhA [Candidatus Competibacteraceae bacterium]MBK8895734.1 flagellar biosynthesis protein FlhA [Candidatus Competibacteraceae bacterium]MBK8962826.1 flagellar biosynthesis protein FlhA [Candidatus Competibacteraceae bacterium]MBK9953241.1 flagellar biosynthesis protein FlhA [Candidatus Competibacteraceae bacterium]
MNLAATLTGMARSGLGAPALLVVILMMVVVPLPPFVLDVFFTFNIALSLVILLATVYSERPLDFAVFPTVLLVSTLLRLALNVASTRVVLLNGHAGGDAAGKVIEAFGHFVVGGNFAVGLVVFAILTIINFVVVTKGAGRVSEVSARFTLDAMPGKQMAIDADLNAGIIDQAEAKRRRSEVVQEADFYGSMDGASKFVRGDAIAGILILFINMLGGIAIGTLQHNLPLAEAAQFYTLLTIGDGLVAQLPGLLLSTAAAIMVTRASGSQDIGEQVTQQLFGSPQTLGVTAGIIGMLGLIPGMPNLVFLGLSGGAGYMAWRLSQKRRTAPSPTDGGAGASGGPGEADSADNREVGWDDVPPLDTIGMEVGYRLIALVDRNQGGQLLGRIKGVRKKLSQELGFLIPPVHIRDNLDLAPTAYRITLLGVTAAESEAFPDRQLAINPGQVHTPLPGLATQDPAFKLPAVWIEANLREQAQTLGYTVVDASTVIATHLNQILLGHAHELLGHEETQQLLDRLAQAMPRLVQDLVPKTLVLRVVVRVLQNLLVEQVPIRDMRTIAETLAEHGSRSQDPDVLTAAVRIALGRMIIQNINSLEDELAVITLAAELEQILLRTLQMGRDEQAPLEPGLAERLHKALMDTTQKQELVGQPAVLLVPDAIRVMLARFVRHGIPNLHVLAFSEIPEDKKLKVIATVGK